MYKTILVPLDGSGRAEAILPHVQALAAAHQSLVILLGVVEPGPVLVDPHETRVQLYLDELKRRTDDATTYLDTRCGELNAMGLNVETRLVHGPVVEAIIQIAESEGADLIAMASHGRSGLGRVFYGSVAAGVLQRVDRPLLLIRSREEGD